ncbi:MAG: DUF2065 domain-containing protein [Thiomicrorhabdus chilensis]|uniref:DUF2065 domain-containing protein n=1 Tax=Thiomicrorhabdus chilensis TaxID=63656 RepID=UPI0004037022|nr:DUF2065 domain-containing protein [Thiomicrorhabdus chilensis]MDX1348320.1 DUF2065 domain-containing protein [Thiomicrorhabdus chilensis]
MENTLIAAIALVFILEGLLPFVFPEFWRKVMTEAVQLTEKQIRIMGLVSLSAGMALLLFFS